MNLKALPRLIDLSCVRANVTKTELEQMVELAVKHNFVCCFAMPFYTEWLCGQLSGYKAINVGGSVGFPSGADLTETKVDTAKRMLEYGCDELDMVINVSALKSGEYKAVEQDIREVKEAAGEHTLKVILELTYLTEYEIQKGCELAIKAGASYVKTGTGWAEPTTAAHIKLIKSVVGNQVKIKAAGGIRNLAAIKEMYDAGCTRFGIGVTSAQNILAEAGILQE